MHASDHPTTDACAELLQSMRAFAALRRGIRSAIPADAFSWLPVLMALHRHRDGLRIGQLADELHVDPSVASRQFARLEGSGHAHRVPDPDDGRAHLLLLTQAGTRQLESSLQAIATHLAESLTGWNDEDVGRLTRDLTRLTSSIESGGDASTRPVALVSPFHASPDDGVSP